MALTRDFKETVKLRAMRDPEFRVGLLQEALNALLDADMATGKLLLRDYVNGTVGFETLGAQLHKNPKSLMRMLSEQGNPRADNLLELVAQLKGNEGVSFSVQRNAS